MKKKFYISNGYENKTDELYLINSLDEASDIFDDAIEKMNFDKNKILSIGSVYVSDDFQPFNDFYPVKEEDLNLIENFQMIDEFEHNVFERFQRISVLRRLCICVNISLRCVDIANEIKAGNIICKKESGYVHYVYKNFISINSITNEVITDKKRIEDMELL